MDTCVEIVSPLDHTDITHICRVARIPELVATCAGCGETLYRRVHLPLIAFGFWCSRCCPCRTFAPTPEEVEAMERNRAGRDAGGEDAAREFRSHKANPNQVDCVPPKERRARTSKKLAEAVRARWRDPAARAKMLKGMTDRHM